MNLGVQNLSGCGPKYTEILNNNGIITTKDLSDSKLVNVEGIPLGVFLKLKKQATDMSAPLKLPQFFSASVPYLSTQTKSKVEEIKEFQVRKTENHSWYNLNVRIFRGPKPKIIYAQIKELLFQEHNISFHVRWFSKNKFIHKCITPMAIAHLYIMNKSLVGCTSEDDDPDCKNNLEDQILETTEILPEFTVSEAGLKENEKNSLKTYIYETNKMLESYMNSFNEFD
jgi:hypothetical protein